MSTARPVHDARHTCAALLVDILSRLNGKGAADARAFAGIGRQPARAAGTSAPSSTSPTPTGYAKEFPDGRYEAGAEFGPDEWTNLRIEIDGTRLTVAVNRTKVLTLTETKAAPAAGNIGLFVDIGSESFFSNLEVTPN